MLKVLYTSLPVERVLGFRTLHSVSGYFDGCFDETWFNDGAWIRYMLKDVEGTEMFMPCVFSNAQVNSFPPQWLTEEAKALILLDKYCDYSEENINMGEIDIYSEMYVMPGEIFEGKSMDWLFDLAQKKDIIIYSSSPVVYNGNKKLEGEVYSINQDKYVPIEDAYSLYHDYLQNEYSEEMEKLQYRDDEIE